MEVEVSSVVNSILSAFNTGLDIFKRMRRKSKSKRRAKDPPTQEELQLQESLQHRPQEIKSSYDRGVAKLGQRFEIGDAIAHTSLAKTLLALNAGLISILNNALYKDPKKRSMSQQSLLSLSEIAAADAMQALNQLDLRLTLSQLAPKPEPAMRHSKKTAAQEPVEKAKLTKRVEARGSNNPFKLARRPAPSPLRVRGGWVRSKSTSSESSAASTSKTSVARPADHKRSKSSPQLLNMSQESKTQLGPSLPPRTQTPPEPTANVSASSEPTHQHQQRRRVTPSNPRPQREQSMPFVSPDFFAAQPTDGPNQHQSAQPQTSPPPIPPKIPLHSRPTTTNNNQQPSGTITRARPASVATFMTASTKIGEIPEHLWPDRPALQNGQNRPLPYVIPPPLTPGFNEEKRKAKGRGFRFWKRVESIDEREGANDNDVLVY